MLKILFMKQIVILYIAMFVLVFPMRADTTPVLRDTPYQLDPGVYDDKDQFHILIGSISTTDQRLFPGIGQIILHTAGNSQDFRIKGTVVVTPGVNPEYLYFSLEDINHGQEFNVIHATKYGITIPVLKMQLHRANMKISALKGGILKIRILKNAFFYSFRDFEFQLTRANSKWIGKVKSGDVFIPVHSLHLIASKVGVKNVVFM